MTPTFTAKRYSTRLYRHFVSNEFYTSNTSQWTSDTHGHTTIKYQRGPTGYRATTMNSGHSTPSPFPPPHFSHAEPWAHNVICCDTDHNASTSRPSTPITRFTNHHRSHPSTSTINSFDVPVSAQTSTCCDEAHCADVGGLECCTDPSCQPEATCEEQGCRFPHNPDAAPGDPDSAESMRELERWACSKEGCHAIQQYVSSYPITFAWAQPLGTIPLANLFFPIIIHRT